MEDEQPDEGIVEEVEAEEESRWTELWLAGDG